MPAYTKFYNPLDAFSSYSVQYIMLACRTTEEARAFIDEKQQEDTLSAITATKRLGDAISYNGKQEVAYLVMDTRRFAQFSIDRLKYEVLINGLQKSGSHGNLATTIEMTIIDSVGISFINFLQWLMDFKMQCNFDGMIFMLRVMFVGHTPEGNTETVQTLTIPMHLFKLEMNLDYSKGVYNAEFMPNINFDATQHRRWLNISQASSYFTGNGDNKLGSLINSFEAELNKRSATYYENATSVLQQARPGKLTSAGKYGRQVKYLITIPKQWEDMLLTGGGSGDATEIIHTSLAGLDGTTATKKAKSEAEKNKNVAKPGKSKNTNISVEMGMQITEVLDIIFRQVHEIDKLGSGQVIADAKVFYKHLVGITSNDDFMVVHVDVIPFKVPNVLSDQKKAVAQDDQDFYRALENGVRIPKDFIEFHYIYTGKNQDILNFDMKVQDLQWMLATNLEMGSNVMKEQAKAGQNPSERPPNPNAELVTTRPYDPILLPKNTADELANFSAITSITPSAESTQLRAGRQKYTQNVAAFYAMAPITAHLTIRGNPEIMLKFSTPSFLNHVSADTAVKGGQTSTTNLSVKANYRKDLEDRIIRNNTRDEDKVKELGRDGPYFIVNSLSKTSYTASPVFVKINVKGPNVDFLSNELINEADFATEVLYDNFYVVMKVTNLIEGSKFTQDLELFSHNVFGQGKLQGLPDKSVPKAAEQKPADGRQRGGA